MNAIRGIFRAYVVIALVIWTTLVGIPIIFQGGNVSQILEVPEGSTASGDHGLPWVTIWVVGVLVILAIGFLTRKRVGP